MVFEYQQVIVRVTVGIEMARVLFFETSAIRAGGATSLHTTTHEKQLWYYPFASLGILRLRLLSAWLLPAIEEQLTCSEYWDDARIGFNAIHKNGMARSNK